MIGSKIYEFEIKARSTLKQNTHAFAFTYFSFRPLTPTTFFKIKNTPAGVTNFARQCPYGILTLQYEEIFLYK